MRKFSVSYGFENMAVDDLKLLARAEKWTDELRRAPATEKELVKFCITKTLGEHIDDLDRESFHQERLLSQHPATLHA